MRCFTSVEPSLQRLHSNAWVKPWIPAFAGMTSKKSRQLRAHASQAARLNAITADDAVPAPDQARFD
jgi:hypothetical protein